MFGPSTDPIVVAQTTQLSCRPRCSGSARSVAAYLAWELAVVEAPKSVVPRSSSQNCPSAVAVIASSAPTVPIRYAVPRPARRPHLPMRAAIGIVNSAPPSTWVVLARPESASRPLTSAATMAATAIPLATPIPPRVWLPIRVRTVRCCIWWAAVSAGRDRVTRGSLTEESWISSRDPVTTCSGRSMTVSRVGGWRPALSWKRPRWL